LHDSSNELIHDRILFAQNQRIKNKKSQRKVCTGFS
jgi:hypothetical protein